MKKLFKLLVVSMFLMSVKFAHAEDITMNLNIIPDFGLVRSTGVTETLDITHSGTNCKYSIAFKAYSKLDGPWGIKISATPMLSTDGKDQIASALVNYKIYGGSATAIPSQSSNIWLPLPTVPTLIYQSNDSEKNIQEVPFNIFIFVTPRTAQMQKIYQTRVTISLVTL